MWLHLVFEEVNINLIDLLRERLLLELRTVLKRQLERIRNAFLDIAEEEPARCVVIDARKPEALVAEDVWEAVAAHLRP